MRSHYKRVFAWFCDKMNVWASIEIQTQSPIALDADVRHSEEDPGKSKKYKKVWAVRNAILEINLYTWGSSITGYW